MQSLNTVLKTIKDVANLHTQINTYAQGQAYDFSASEALLYPCLWAIPQGLTIASGSDSLVGNSVDYRVQVYMMDIENNDGTNEIDVLNDTALILLDIIAYLDDSLNDNNELSLSGVGNLEPFVDARLDTVSGHSCELVFTAAFLKDNCTGIII